MSRVLPGLRSAAWIRPEERVVAGRVGAVVWVIASLSVIGLALVLPDAQVHRTVLLAMGLAGCAWGALSGLLLDYRRLSIWVIHVSGVVGTAAIALSINFSGGARSPAWACLFYVVVFSAYFFTPQAAAAYFVACVAVEAAVVLASSPSESAEAAARLIVAGPAFVVVGVAILGGKRSLWSLRRRAERLAAEQGALRRVATAVVTGESAESFYQRVAVEAGQLLGASAAGILRLGGRGEATILGSWAREPERQYGVGANFPVPVESEVATALAAGRPMRVEAGAHSPVGRLGYKSSIVAPIKVGGRLWGFLNIVSERSGGLGGDHARRLNEFADLIATAVTSIEDRAALAAQAATDPLTGVGNHRTFHQRLTADLARVRRYGTAVSVAIIDVDHFKQVNDTGGHEAGDEMLIKVAHCLSEAARAEDTLARVGGDEFAWILPETTGEEALAAVERARRAIIAGSEADGALRVTISSGVCDTRWTTDAAELVRLADRALYTSKEHGRDQVRLYAPTSADELAAH